MNVPENYFNPPSKITWQCYTLRDLQQIIEWKGHNSQKEKIIKSKFPANILIDSCYIMPLGRDCVADKDFTQRGFYQLSFDPGVGSDPA